MLERLVGSIIHDSFEMRAGFSAAEVEGLNRAMKKTFCTGAHPEEVCLPKGFAGVAVGLSVP